MGLHNRSLAHTSANFREPWPRAGLLKSTKRLAALAIVAQATGCASSAAAACTKGKAGLGSVPTAYPPRVQKVLEYLDENPMRYYTIPLIYEADPSSSHLPAVIQGLTPADVMPGQRRGVDPVAAEHYARVVAALLYWACGGQDHAHNLVTPLCWGAPTAYAGQPITGSPAAKDAAYVHAMIHRLEGLYGDEFGDGYKNANYWYAAAGPHPIYPRVLESMREFALGDETLERQAESHGDTFTPSKWVAACSKSLRGTSHSVWAERELNRWVEKVMAAEFRAMLEHTYGKLVEVA